MIELIRDSGNGAEGFCELHTRRTKLYVVCETYLDFMIREMNVDCMGVTMSRLLV